MPYITAEDRDKVDIEVAVIIRILDENKWSVGMVNYVFSTILWTWFKTNVGYTTINAIVGVLGCVKDEFYRRLAADYEDVKRYQNGDLAAYLHYGDGK